MYLGIADIQIMEDGQVVCSITEHPARKEPSSFHFKLPEQVISIKDYLSFIGDYIGMVERLHGVEVGYRCHKVLLSLKSLADWMHDIQRPDIYRSFKDSMGRV
jgi:hypothetical protein